jgi:amino acid permease
MTSMLVSDTTVYICHLPAPRFHAELENNTDARFNTVVAASFAVSAACFIVVALSGFLTFGASSDGFILNNYSAFDPLVTASRLSLALSLVFTYPLPFVG